MMDAVPLRTEGWLANWRRRLADYPDIPQKRIIAANISVWGDAHAPDVRWTLCDREDYLSLTERLMWDVYNILRVLFALNRQWEPDWQWLRHWCQDLDNIPDRLADRVNAIFSGPDARVRVAQCQRLILDTLVLLPPSAAVARAQVSIEKSLRAHVAEPTR